MTNVVAFVPDLMDRSKVAAAGGDRVRFVGSAAGLAEVAGAGRVDLVLVDLSRPGVREALAALRSIEPRPHVIGFGSHVDRDALEAARVDGCDQVLARSAFFGRLPDLLSAD